MYILAKVFIPLLCTPIFCKHPVRRSTWTWPKEHAAGKGSQGQAQCHLLHLATWVNTRFFEGGGYILAWSHTGATQGVDDEPIERG